MYKKTETKRKLKNRVVYRKPAYFQLFFFLWIKRAIVDDRMLESQSGKTPLSIFWTAGGRFFFAVLILISSLEGDSMIYQTIHI